MTDHRGARSTGRAPQSSPSPEGASDSRPVRLHRGAAGAELLGLSSRLLELRTRVRVDQLPRLDPLEPVPLQELRTLPSAAPRQFSRPTEVDVATAVLAAGFWLVTSAIWMRPPGTSTRWSSEKTASLSGIRSMTPFEITTSKLSSGNGSATAVDELDLRDPELLRGGARLASIAAVTSAAQTLTSIGMGGGPCSSRSRRSSGRRRGANTVRCPSSSPGVHQR